ncbi:TPA: 50S ribosomal protein L7/L12 [bacterium]|nr:50S ribosomal protein L7/L12 [bacterium]
MATATKDTTKSETATAKTKKLTTTESLVEAISNLTVLELSELIKELQDRFGVQIQAPVMAVPSGQAQVAEVPEEEEEKTEFTVILSGIGSQKIQVIKEVRALTSLGLKEAKELVESAPKPVKEGISKEEAEKIREKLEAVGATVEIK